MMLRQQSYPINHHRNFSDYDQSTDKFHVMISSSDESLDFEQNNKQRVLETSTVI